MSLVFPKTNSTKLTCKGLKYGHLSHKGLSQFTIINSAEVFDNNQEIIIIIVQSSTKARIIQFYEKNKYHSAWQQEMYNSCMSVFPNTSAWKQQEVNNTKEAAEEDMKRSVNVE